MLELEKTYLAKYLPEGITKCEVKEISDLYVPYQSEYPKMRVRRRGDKYEITKKVRMDAADAGAQEEETILLNPEEYAALAQAPGKRLNKLRYEYPCGEAIAHVDVFQGELFGLVVVSFAFDSVEEKDTFSMPDFCLADVTQEDFIAGGMLCGKKYEDVEKDLARFGYQKLFVQA